MQIDNLGVFITIGISIIIGLVAFLSITNRKKSEYNKNDQKVVLEEVRNSFEKQIYALNDRLIQSEERWRDVNHLLLRKEYTENNTPLESQKKIHYSEFLKANGIAENELIIDKRLIFVLTPFNNQFYNEFMTIKEVCSSIGFNCVRGDEKQFKGDIFPEMLRYIAQARIIIANINGRNPNVLYELGVAQALDKSVILVSKEPKDLPVDIQSQRFLIYSDSRSLEESLKTELQKLI
jgi:hypothetical protein